MSIQCWV